MARIDCERLRAYFVRKGIKQADIATRLGRSVSYVNDLLNGRADFGRRTAGMWAKEFGVNESWLLGNGGPMLLDASENEQEKLETMAERETRSSNAILADVVRDMRVDARDNYQLMMRMYMDMCEEMRRHDAAMEAEIKELRRMVERLGGGER